MEVDTNLVNKTEKNSTRSTVRAPREACREVVAGEGSGLTAHAYSAYSKYIALQ
jgi:hypothetical protein